MSSASKTRAFRRRASPRAAAIAGVLFAVLFATSLVLLVRSYRTEGRAGENPANEGQR